MMNDLKRLCILWLGLVFKLMEAADGQETSSDSVSLGFSLYGRVLGVRNPDPCSASPPPCKKGMICTSTNSTHTKCLCPNNKCELNSVLCSSNKCQNNGVCFIKMNKPVCECPAHFTGPNCETMTNLYGITKINLNGNNAGSIINQTYDLIKQSYANWKVFDQRVRENMELVADMFDNLVKSSQSDKTLLNNKIGLDSIVGLVNECIDQASFYNTPLIMNSTQRMSRSVEQLVSSNQLKSIYSLEASNLAVLSYNINNTMATQLVGFKLESNKMSVLRDQISPSSISASLNLSSIDHNTQNASARLSFMVYESSVMFDITSSKLQSMTSLDCSNLKGGQIASNVVSVTTDLVFKPNSPFVRTDFKLLPKASQCLNRLGSVKFDCVFWDYNTARWSSTGCSYQTTLSGTHTCTCNHLTNFAILMSFDDSKVECEACKLALKYVSYIGNGVSILGLSLTILIFLRDYIKKTRNKSLNQETNSSFMFNYYIQILITLSTSLLAMNILYIVFSFLKWSQSIIPCMIFGVLLHYCLLCSFCWMLCFSVLQYLAFSKVLVVVNRFYLFSSLFSFGAPLVPITIILSINWQYYQHSSSHCWPSNLSALFGVTIPIAAIVITNTVLFSLIFYNSCSRNVNNETSRVKVPLDHNLSSSWLSRTRRQTAILSTCFTNMGLTWTFGFLLMFNTLDETLRLTLAFLFCLFNSCQGFLMFVAYIVFSQSRRQHFRDSVSDKLKQFKHTDTTDK